jgi:hypothetical protein
VPDACMTRLCVCQVFKILGTEGVKNCQREDASCDPRQEWVIHQWVSNGLNRAVRRPDLHPS